MPTYVRDSPMISFTYSHASVVTVSIQLVIHRNLIVQENHLSYIVPMMSIHVMRD